MVAAGVSLEDGRLVRINRRVDREEKVVCVVTDGSVEVTEWLEEGCEEEEAHILVRSVGVSTIHTE